jgi:hypothetical protein
VHVLDALHDLVYYVAFMNILQNVGLDHGVQVGLHVVKNQVDVSVVLRSDHILKPNNVVVSMQFLEENYLSERSLGICCILKSIKYFFKGHDFLSALVDGLPHNSVGSFSYLVRGAYLVFVSIRISLKYEARPLLSYSVIY